MRRCYRLDSHPVESELYVLIGFSVGLFLLTPQPLGGCTAQQNRQPMPQGGGTQLLSANSRWPGPGGESILQLQEGNLIAFHAYDAITGKPGLQLSMPTWKMDGHVPPPGEDGAST